MGKERKKGCLKALASIITVFMILLFVFYMNVWRVPDNSKRAEKELERIRQRIEKENSVPDEINGWKDYEKAAELLKYSNFTSFEKDRSLQTIAFERLDEKDIPYVRKYVKDKDEVFEQVRIGYNRILAHPDSVKNNTSPEITDNLPLDRLFFLLDVMGDLEVMNQDFLKASDYYLQGLFFGLARAKCDDESNSIPGLTVINCESDSILMLIKNRQLDSKTLLFIKEKLQTVEKNYPSFNRFFEISFTEFRERVELFEKSGSNYPISYYLFTVFHIPVPESFESVVNSLPGGFIFKREERIAENQYFWYKERISANYSKTNNAYFSFQYPLYALRIDFADSRWESFYDIWALALSKLRGTLILTSLECYRLDKGSYPKSLKDLVPDYLPEIPEDPYAPDGQFKYVRQGKDVLLYSIGPDQKDDRGGVVSNNSYRGPGDIVFVKPDMIKMRNRIKKTKKK